MPTFTSSMLSTVCEGDPFTMSTPTTGAQYEWIIFKQNENAQTPVGIYTTQVATWNTTAGMSAGSYHVRLRVRDNCCGWSIPVYFSFIVSASGNAPQITGDTICQGEIATITAHPNGANLITFFEDPLGQIVLQSSADSTFTTAPLTQNTVFYASLGAAACSRNLAAIPVVVNPRPLAPSVRDLDLCANENVILTAIAQGGTINWYNSPTATTPIGIGNTFDAGTMASGVHIFYAEQIVNGCASERAPLTVRINDIPTMPSASSLTICANMTATLTATGTSIRWYADAALNNQIATGNNYTTPILTTNTTYYFTSTNTNGCTSTAANVTVSIEALPNAPLAIGDTICNNESTTLTANHNGGTVRWYSEPTTTMEIGIGATFNTPNLFQTTTYFFREENANGCLSPISNVTVVVQPTPQAPIAIAQNICEGEDLIINASSSSTGDFIFYDNNMNNIAIGTTPSYNHIITGLSAANHTFYVGIDNGTCISSLTTVNVAVYATPPTPIVNDTTICAHTNVTLNASGIGIRWYDDAALTNQVAAGNAFTTPILSNTTTYYITSESREGCTSALATLQVNIEALPNAPVITPVTICTNQSATLTASNNGGTTLWFTDASASLQIATGITFTTPTLYQTATYFVREMSTTGCLSNIIPVTITVEPTIQAPSVRATIACEGEDVILTALSNVNGNFVFYDNNMNIIGTGTTPSYNHIITGFSAGNHIFYVGVDNGTCISNLETVNVTINARPIAPITTDITICANTNATLSATGTSIRWYADAALTNQVAVGNSFVTPALQNNTTYYVTSDSREGCTSTASIVNVTIEALPSAPIVNNAAICANTATTLTSSNNGGTILWFADANANMQIATGTSFTTPILYQTTTYFVREVSTSGCMSNITAITVMVEPIAQAPSASANTICEGEDLIITALTSTNNDFIFYDSNMNILGRGTAPMFNYTITAPNAGNHVFYVGIENGTCISNLAAVNAIVNAIPSAPIANNTTICPNTNATLTATGTGIRWYTDAALTSQVASGNTFVTTALTNTTIFYVTSESRTGCQSAATIVTVNIESTIAAPTTTPSTVCYNQNATLSAMAAGTGILAWYDDASALNQIATGSTLTINNANQSANYYVRELGANGCASALATVRLTVTNNIAAPSVLPTEICEGQNAILSATGNGNGTIIFYDNNNTEVGRGTMSNTQPTITVSIPALTTGTHIYTAIVDNNCISDAAIIQVRVNAAPATITAHNDGPSCEGESIVLQATSVAGAIYTWTGPNGFAQNGQTVFLDNVEHTMNGVYTVIANVGNCFSASASTTINVLAKPVYTGAITSNSPLCEGETLSLAAPLEDGFTYTWRGPNGFTATGPNLTINNVNEDAHQGVFSVLATNADGCVSDPITILVNINAIPSSIFAMSNSPVCENGTLNLMVPAVFGATYRWNGPNGITSTDRSTTFTNVTQNFAGIYEVEIDVRGCIATISTEVAVTPAPNAQIMNDTSIGQGNRILLGASGGALYQWTGSHMDYLTNSNSPNPTFQAIEIGDFTYNVEIGNMSGCTVQRSVTIHVKGSQNPVFVDLFTPNGDGINDTWTIGNLSNFRSYTLTIYSRAGFEVLSTQNYMNDWDGTRDGKALPDGTYWYVLQVDEAPEHAAAEYRGAVTIKR